ncbi:MAG: Hsp20/alpha crystallin family protein [Candidatus Lokiarchaeota archaeon]
MSESIEKTSEEEGSKKEERKKSIISPQICSYDTEESDGFIIEVILPGVEKDTINLKLDDENIFVSGETDSLRYVGAYGLCCAVEEDFYEFEFKNL